MVGFAHPPAGSRASQRGIALLVVLWSMLLLGTLATAFSFSMRTEAQAARNGWDATRAYYQARTGIFRAVALLSALPADNVLGMTIAGEEDDLAYEVTIQPEDGKVDINFVPEATLKEMLEKGGLPKEEAEKVADAVLDWRDEDDDPRPLGAESTDYASLPEPLRPRNGKLAALEELQCVKHVTPQAYRRILSRVFTVHGRSAQVNANHAPEAVLAALPGVTAEAARKVVERRRDDPFRSPADLASFLSAEGIPPAALSVLSTGGASGVYAITAVGKAGGNARRAVRCLAEASAPGAGPVTILGWSEHAEMDEEASAE